MGLHKYSSNDDNDKRERKNIIDYYTKKKIIMTPKSL